MLAVLLELAPGGLGPDLMVLRQVLRGLRYGFFYCGCQPHVVEVCEAVGLTLPPVKFVFSPGYEYPIGAVRHRYLAVSGTFDLESPA